MIMIKKRNAEQERGVVLNAEAEREVRSSPVDQKYNMPIKYDVTGSRGVFKLYTTGQLLS